MTVLFICIHSIHFNETRRTRSVQRIPVVLLDKPKEDTIQPILSDGEYDQYVAELSPTLDNTPDVPRALLSYGSGSYSPIAYSPMSSPSVAPPAPFSPSNSKSKLQESNHDPSDISQNLQLAVTTIQNELVTLEGDLNKLVADDKGLIAVVVFGLPPMYDYV